MERDELLKLKQAARNMKTENDTFSISGDSFSCRWNGREFIWMPPSGFSFVASVMEVCQWIGNGEYITDDYCFSYGD